MAISFPVKADLFNACQFTPSPSESVERNSQISDEDEESDNSKDDINSIEHKKKNS